ncbi:MAG: ribonuclease R [Saprospiraceae bacterium]|nr:ribonuclease R [Saprospiraceae bacterium]
MKKSKKKENKISTQELQKSILKLFRDNPTKKFSARHIIEKLGIGNNKDSVRHALEQLELSGKLAPAQTRAVTVKKKAAATEESLPSSMKTEVKKSTTRSQPPKGAVAKRGTYIGIVDMTKSGSAYVVCEGLETDIFVPAKLLMGAMNGDQVKVSAFFPAFGRSTQRRRPDGEVVDILKRSATHFIGIFRYERRWAVVYPDRIDVPEIAVRLDDTKDAKEGEKVVVEITDWGSGRNKKMFGKVTTVLGMPGSSSIEMQAILINNGFNITFPDDVLAETEKIDDDTPRVAAHTEGDGIAVRRDFREVTTFTIDPFDAKDFDDALSFQVLQNGHIEVGVHIADVTHYIKPQTALDKEAYLRSTSVYLVDRVCPMLPERLSNELCSLRPNEDKLTFSAVFEFDEKFKIVKKWFGKTIIHSKRRYAYEEAQAILESREGDFVDELAKLNQIAHHLRKKRFKNGAINFETDEVKFKLDEQGVPIEVFVKERKEAHLLIEDFMLLANKEVATFMAKRDARTRSKGMEVPYIYRVHDLPDVDKLRDFAAFARELGVSMNLDTPQNIAKSLNELAKKAEKDENLKVLTPIAIRCMAKAAYSSDNVGHYGLAFEFYSHFTSPIRRYSDVLAHRILFENLATIKRVDKEKLEEQCKHISKQEKKAADAERQSIKYKQVEYIKGHIGETFEGVVSGMLERGIFVEIKHMLTEGMVEFGRCPEFFEVEPTRLKAKGVKTGRILKMGQSVKVQIVDADLESRQIDMRLLEF